MLVSFVYVAACRLFALVLLLARGDRSKELEIVLLRHELSILRRQTRRPQLTARDRLVLATLSRVLPRLSWYAFLVTPETLLRWSTVRGSRDTRSLGASAPRGRPDDLPTSRQALEVLCGSARARSLRRSVAAIRARWGGTSSSRRAASCSRGARPPE